MDNIRAVILSCLWAEYSCAIKIIVTNGIDGVEVGIGMSTLFAKVCVGISSRGKLFLS